VKKKSTETSKKSKTSKKSTTSKKAKKSKRKSDDESFSGIVIVDDDLSIDKEAELEERRAFLEEARSQEASSD
tara:strand:- start:413 stop:631 length:219 start_codon:yes stop_codon:yes gene_type:complete